MKDDIAKHSSRMGSLSSAQPQHLQLQQKHQQQQLQQEEDVERLAQKVKHKGFRLPHATRIPLAKEYHAVYWRKREKPIASIGILSIVSTAVILIELSFYSSRLLYPSSFAIHIVDAFAGHSNVNQHSFLKPARARRNPRVEFGSIVSSASSSSGWMIATVSGSRNQRSQDAMARNMYPIGNDNLRTLRNDRPSTSFRIQRKSLESLSSMTRLPSQLQMMMGGSESLLTCVIAGSVAGAVGVGVSYPLDTIKTKQQVLSSLKSSKLVNSRPSVLISQGDNDIAASNLVMQEELHQEVPKETVIPNRHHLRDDSEFSLISKIYQQEGCAGFYKGVATTMIGQAVLKSMAFTTNAMAYHFLIEQQQHQLHQSSSSVQQLLSDVSVGGSSSSTLDLLKNVVATIATSMNNIQLSETEILLLAACFSGFTTSFFVVPIERVKIMMQSQPRQKRSNSARLYLIDDDTRTSFRATVGSGNTGMGAVPATATSSSSSFALGGTAALAIRPATVSNRSPRSGTATTASSSFVSEYNKRTYVNEFDCAKVIIEKDGWYGFFFRGLTPTLWREVPRYGLYFFVYELLVKWDIFQSVDPFYLPLLCGALAGCMSWLPVYPADVIKTTIQNTEGVEHGISHRDHDPIQLGRHLYEEGGGIVTFYGGLTPKLLRAALINAITFFMYDTVVSFLS